MTMLRHTSTVVARKSIASDLSFLAICVYKARRVITRHTVSGQQSSAGLREKAPASQGGAPCVPSSQSSAAEDRLTTAHRSQLRTAEPAEHRQSFPARSAVNPSPLVRAAQLPL